MIWLSETNILKNITVVSASERNDAEVREQFASIVQLVDIHNSKTIHSRELAYPTAVFDEYRIVSGADKIINSIICDGYLPRLCCRLEIDSDEAGISINWDQLTLFNFYSCGLLPEIGNMIVEHREGEDKLEECLKLHEENIHLQVYMKADTIQHFREEQTLRHEVMRLTDENERLVKIVCDTESELAAEKIKNAKERSSLISDKTRLLGDLRDSEKRLYQLNLDLQNEKKKLAMTTSAFLTALSTIREAFGEKTSLDANDQQLQEESRIETGDGEPTARSSADSSEKQSTMDTDQKRRRSHKDYHHDAVRSEGSGSNGIDINDATSFECSGTEIQEIVVGIVELIRRTIRKHDEKDSHIGLLKTQLSALALQYEAIRSTLRE